MFSESLANLKNALFDSSEPIERKLLVTSINTTTGSVARLYGEPIHPNEIIEKQKVIADVISRYGLVPNDETASRVTLEIIGRSDLSGLSWDELDMEFDKDPELDMYFHDQLCAVSLALEQLQGGMPIEYNVKPITFAYQGQGGSKRGAIGAILLLLGTSAAVTFGYKFWKNRNNNDNGDNEDYDNGKPNGNTTNGNTTNGNITEPVDIDTDSDGYLDKVETEAGSDPYNPQSIPGNIDADPLPDTYEQDKFGDLRYDGSEDPDNDMKTIIEEYMLGTDPLEFEENVKNRLTQLGYSEEQTQHVFDQILELIEDPNYSQEAAAGYDSRIAGLEEYEIRALVERTIEKDEHIARGDWDRDGDQNIADAQLFDPTNTRERLKEESVEYVEKVVEYNDEQNPGELLPELYEEGSLGKAMDFVEARSEIVADINKYGADALPIILSDKDMVEIAANPRYQLLMHAVVMQAQKYFYDVKNTVDWGKWDGPDNGMMLNDRLDPKEKQILDQRWEDRDILLVDGEERMANLRYRFLNERWFWTDAETGRGRVEDWHHEDTDTWIRNCLRNIELCPQIREQLLEVLNDPEQRNQLIERFVSFYAIREGIGERFREYSEAILHGGDEWDKKLMALNMIARTMVGHETYISTGGLYASFLGKNIYSSQGTFPGPGGKPDGKPAIVFSPQAMEAIRNIGDPTMDDETGALPVLYGVERDLLESTGVRYLVIKTEDGIKTLYGQKD